MQWLAIGATAVWFLALWSSLGVLRGPGVLRRVRKLVEAAMCVVLGGLLVGVLILLRAFLAFSGETLVAEVRTRWLSPTEFELTYTPARAAGVDPSTPPPAWLRQTKPVGSLPGPPSNALRAGAGGMSPTTRRGVVLPRTECRARHEVSERSESWFDPLRSLTTILSKAEGRVEGSKDDGSGTPDLPKGLHSGRTMALRGDQWAVSGGLVKWHPWLTAMGWPSYHKPMRLSGQFSSLEEQRRRPPTVEEIAEPGVDRFWEAVYWADPYLPFVEAVYGSSAYAYVEPGAVQEIYVTPSGYLIKNRARGR